jgi:ADP-ribosylglycohydrolase
MLHSSEYLQSPEYEQRVYAGVLGKLIGVYLGRPFEQWSNEQIERELGEVNYYVHEKLKQPLIVTDDDISGTFTFIRGLAENGNDPDLTPAQIGDWWLNSIIENRTILWWGGLGVSTEHTAYLRLKAGLQAPDSGSLATNGVAVAEEIGAQIFIDGWGMVCPRDPAKAAEWARRAASVSHDGEAIYGAQVIAAMEAASFAESDLNVLLDTAAALIPKKSVIYALIADMRQWAAENGDDWRATLKRIHEVYPYARFGTNCPMVSNHAIILLALLHGKDDFQRSLMIANTAGYDTDCNSGNVGCLLGIKNGLAGIEAGPDWRGPVADRLFLPTADGARCITDAVRETYSLVNSARGLAGLPPTAPKQGARFHFSLPGSVQGFGPEDSPQVRGVVTVANDSGKLALHLHHLAAGRAARAATATFIPPSAITMGGYDLVCSPTLYSGQTVTAQVSAGNDLSGPVSVSVYVRVYGENNRLTVHRGPVQTLSANGAATLTLTVPDTEGQPVAEVGLEITSGTPVSGTVLMDTLTWEGVPSVTFGKAAHGDLWKRAWVDSVSQFETSWGSGPAYKVMQNNGTGLLTQGEYEWTDYTVSAKLLPHIAKRLGLAGAVRGLRRYVALVLDEDRRVRLIEQRDGVRRILAESNAVWRLEEAQILSLTITPSGITARYGGETLTAAGDSLPTRGAVGLLADTGCGEFGPVTVRPA